MKHFKAPKRMSVRRSMPSKCFLVPGKRKYPVCRATSKKPVCEGALAARRRAILNSDHRIASAALKLGKKLGCTWAK